MVDTQARPTVDLKEFAESYSYDEAFFADVYARIRDKAAAFDSHFGPILNAHHDSVRHDTEQFMIGEGYSPDVAKKIGHAFGAHDSGKTLQDSDLWRQTAEKRVFTREQKKEREKHGRLGVQVLDDTISEMGHALTPDQSKHVELMKYLMVNHHERLNGTGPEAMPGHEMDPVLRIVTIVDTVDGKKKAKGLSAIFDDMSGAEGTKHEGQYDKALVARYKDYYRTAHEANAQPSLAKQAHTL